MLLFASKMLTAPLTGSVHKRHSFSDLNSWHSYDLGNRKGRGGQNVSCDFGGGNPTRDSDGLCPFPLRKMAGRGQTEGGEYHSRAGGEPKTVSGEGLWHVFPSPEFSTPFVFL